MHDGNTWYYCIANPQYAGSARVLGGRASCRAAALKPGVAWVRLGRSLALPVKPESLRLAMHYQPNDDRRESPGSWVCKGRFRSGSLPALCGGSPGSHAVFPVADLERGSGEAGVQALPYGGCLESSGLLDLQR